MIFCTYLTIYKGNKLPPFYIGSSSVDKVLCGYRGSVSSKMYKDVWVCELKNNPQLFETKIITRHATRQAALDKEDFFHRHFKVMNNSLYINRSRAVGLFGALEVTKETRKQMSLASKNKPKSEEHRQKIAAANKAKAQDPNFRDKLKKPKTLEHSKNVSKALKGKKKTLEHRKALSDAHKGVSTGPCSDSRRESIRRALKGKHTLPLVTCPHCGLQGRSNMRRWHFDNCKKIHQ